MTITGDDGRKEVHLVKGNPIKITTNDEFKEKCSDSIVWVDYKNITKVMLLPRKNIRAPIESTQGPVL